MNNDKATREDALNKHVIDAYKDFHCLKCNGPLFSKECIIGGGESSTIEAVPVMCSKCYSKERRLESNTYVAWPKGWDERMFLGENENFQIAVLLVTRHVPLAEWPPKWELISNYYVNAALRVYVMLKKLK